MQQPAARVAQHVRASGGPNGGTKKPATARTKSTALSQANVKVMKRGSELTVVRLPRCAFGFPFGLSFGLPVAEPDPLPAPASGSSASAVLALAAASMAGLVEVAELPGTVPGVSSAAISSAAPAPALQHKLQTIRVLPSTQ
jgi:hypothetical protein